MIDSLKKIFSFYIEQVGKKMFVFFLFFCVLTSFLAILEPLFFTEVIKIIEAYLKTDIFDQAAFVKVLISWAVLIFVTVILNFIYRYYIADISCLTTFREMIKWKWWDVLQMSYGEYLTKKTGSLYKNFDRWTGVYFTFIFFCFKDLFKNISSVLIIIIIMLFVDVRMTLVSLSMLPVMVALWIYFNVKTYNSQLKLHKKWDKAFGIIGDVLNNFLVSKALVLEKKFIKKLHNEIDYIDSEQKKLSLVWSFSDIYVTVLIAISRVLVLSFWTYFLITDQISFATLFLFFSYLWWVYFPLSFIFWSLKQIQKELSEAQKFHSEFDDFEMDIDDSTQVQLQNVKWNIEFKDVEFSYNYKKQILNKLSFSIKKWEKIAFVWNTWAWKSTIINLLLRFWDVNTGEILIDDHNINSISKSSLRKHIWVVMQDNSLYNTTIRENLLYANEDASEEDLISALQKAEAHFVFNLENELDTVIWERWLKLSGWEKQRLNIARLFLKNPEILVLDEATSALDNTTEKLIQKALDKIMQNRTAIIIAHRLSTIKHVDKIFVLENGTIIESWNYDFLMKKGWKFSELASADHLSL